MKTYLLGILTVVLLLVGFRAAQWKHDADKRGYYAELSGSYLFGPSGMVTVKGEAVSREALIDAALHQWMEHNPQFGLQFKSK